MMKRAGFIALLATFLLATQVAASGDFEPHVLVYAGRMPGYADALAEIINETGTRAVVADSDAVIRSMLGLPQTGCVVIAALNPSDFVFLREFAPVFNNFFDSGGALVGLGACCTTDLESISSTVFPVGGNATIRGKRMGDLHGSTYVLSDNVEGITSGLPESYTVTQEKFAYRSSPGGPLEPASELGNIDVVYREVESGLPLLVTLEGDNGGRSVSLPGCFVVGVERLPFYWGNLVTNPEFRILLKNSVTWAMEGSERFQTLYGELEMALEEESSRLDDIRESGDDATEKSSRARLYMLIGLWAIALVFQGFLVFRFILPRFRSG